MLRINTSDADCEWGLIGDISSECFWEKAALQISAFIMNDVLNNNCVPKGRVNKLTVSSATIPDLYLVRPLLVYMTSPFTCEYSYFSLFHACVFTEMSAV